MFIKVFIPNSRGKIELTAQELEELLSDACEKAVREKCATCNRGYYGGITYCNSQNGNFSLNEVTCDSHQFSAETSTQSTLSSKVNELIGE